MVQVWPNVQGDTMDPWYLEIILLIGKSKSLLVSATFVYIRIF